MKEARRGTSCLLFESTRFLNRRNEVVISALTRRRDALEKEMNREPAPPRAVCFASLEIPRRVPVAPVSLSSLSAPLRRTTRGGWEGEKGRVRAGKRNKTKNSPFKVK